MCLSEYIISFSAWTSNTTGPFKPFRHLLLSPLIPSVKIGLIWLVTHRVWTSCCKNDKACQLPLMCAVNTDNGWTLGRWPGQNQSFTEVNEKSGCRGRRSTFSNTQPTHFSNHFWRDTEKKKKSVTSIFAEVRHALLPLFLAFLCVPMLPCRNDKS